VVVKIRRRMDLQGGGNLHIRRGAESGRAQTACQQEGQNRQMGRTGFHEQPFVNPAGLSQA
jgi:hypothetical protein